MTSTNTNETKFPHVETLLCLQDYTTSMTKSNESLKSCIWSLTKTRTKNPRTNIMSYGSLGENNINCIREEWRARQRLVDTNESEAEAELVDENDDAATEKKTAAPAPPQWKLQDILEEKENTNTKTSKSTTSKLILLLPQQQDYDNVK